MKRLLLCLMVALYACTFAVESHACSLVVGLMNADRPPYFWKDNTGGYKGIFIDVLDEITKETGIFFSYKALPKARLRLYMIVGKIDVEMGVSPQWRQRTAEVTNSVYTESFMETKDVYVSNAALGRFYGEENIPIGSKFCGILGFHYPDKFEERQNFLSEEQLLQMIDKKRCHYSMMPDDVFRYLMLDRSYNIVAGQAVSSHLKLIRLNKQYEFLLPRFNAALQRMKDSGRLAAILERYK
ncbi:substrate-binding periplasmic protein [Halodesulfovibrio aestuarii]|uniref:substrate-binding periplasmic protein n=1 Tax=Halodesulfovibrio aestuarii TaxID=126333 RepID=UPI00351FB3D7